MLLLLTICCSYSLYAALTHYTLLLLTICCSYSLYAALTTLCVLVSLWVSPRCTALCYCRPCSKTASFPPCAALTHYTLLSLTMRLPTLCCTLCYGHCCSLMLTLMLLQHHEESHLAVPVACGGRGDHFDVHDSILELLPLPRSNPTAASSAISCSRLCCC